MKHYRTPEQRVNDAYSFIVMHIFNAADEGRPPSGLRFLLVQLRVVWTGLRHSPGFNSPDFMAYWNGLSEKTKTWPGLS